MHLAPPTGPSRTALATLVVSALVVMSTFVATRATAQPSAPDAAVETGLRTPVLSPRRVPGLLAATVTDSRAREALQPLIDEALPNTCIIVTDHGRVIVDSGTSIVEPASTVKLLTATAVLETLDPASRLRTSFAATSPLADGVLDGDAYLIGGGDPLLTTPGYEVSFFNRDQLKNDFAALADNIVAAGVREIRGGVVGDDSRYDQERWVATWPERYRNQGFVGPLSALMVNDGQTGYTDDPAAPATERQPGDSPLLAAQTLQTLLEERGVRVSGAASTGVAPDGTTEVAGLDSSTIRELVGQMLIESDDTTAELLTKELGLQVAGTGSTAAGTQAIVDKLSAQGLPVDGLLLTDGSGLDEGNRLDCHLLAAVLDRAGPDSELAALLPVAAENGTLRPRMRRTPAQGRVAAKTGTLDHVNALAGFAETDGGQDLTFVYAVVGRDQPRGYVPLDEFAIGLVSLPAGPDLEQLGPKAASG
jgi:D-alanyl-D-alanine carboxypeptidase/D-alanyl-D-alanine-endopeptidase (penicillin-binding protein 4)